MPKGTLTAKMIMATLTKSMLFFSSAQAPHPIRMFRVSASRKANPHASSHQAMTVRSVASSVSSVEGFAITPENPYVLNSAMIGSFE